MLINLYIIIVLIDVMIYRCGVKCIYSHVFCTVKYSYNYIFMYTWIEWNETLIINLINNWWQQSAQTFRAIGGSLEVRLVEYGCPHRFFFHFQQKVQVLKTNPFYSPHLYRQQRRQHLVNTLRIHYNHWQTLPFGDTIFSLLMDSYYGHFKG